jgi:hypothetical protein
MSMSMSTATRLLITISTETKPSRSSRKGDRLIKQDRENGSIVQRTAKEFPIGTRERQKNSTGQVATTRSSQGKSFADGRTRADKTLTEAESATEVGLAIAAERAVKEELAIAEVPVALAIVEGRVIEVARVKSPAVAGPVEAAAEVGPAPLKASIAVVAQRVAPASAEAPAGEALAAAGEGPAGAAAREVEAAEVEAAEDDEDRLVVVGCQLSGWKNGTLERWNVEG